MIENEPTKIETTNQESKENALDGFEGFLESGKQLIEDHKKALMRISDLERQLAMERDLNPEHPTSSITEETTPIGGKEHSFSAELVPTPDNPDKVWEKTPIPEYISAFLEEYSDFPNANVLNSHLSSLKSLIESDGIGGERIEENLFLIGAVLFDLINKIELDTPEKARQITRGVADHVNSVIDEYTSNQSFIFRVTVPSVGAPMNPRWMSGHRNTKLIKKVKNWGVCRSTHNGIFRLKAEVE